MEKDVINFEQKGKKFIVPVDHLFIKSIMVEAYLNDELGLDEEEARQIVELLSIKYNF